MEWELVVDWSMFWRVVNRRTAVRECSSKNSSATPRRSWDGVLRVGLLGGLGATSTDASGIAYGLLAHVMGGSRLGSRLRDTIQWGPYSEETIEVKRQIRDRKNSPAQPMLVVVVQVVVLVATSHSTQDTEDG
jgi:hypothetical protein